MAGLSLEPAGGERRLGWGRVQQREVVCSSRKTSNSGGGSWYAHACRATARNGLYGCMHGVFRGMQCLTVQLKGVGEVQEAATALEMPGNTTNTMTTRERLDLAIKTPNKRLNELEHCMQSLFGQGKGSGAHRTGRNKANVSRSGLRKEGERSPRLELGLG